MSSAPESFDLPVWYHGRELQFSAMLLVMGYTHKIRITIEGIEVIFEPDEEHNYRAIIDLVKVNKTHQPKADLLQAVSKTLTDLFGTA